MNSTEDDLTVARRAYIAALERLLRVDWIFR
jgi:hypothetical protein